MTQFFFLAQKHAHVFTNSKRSALRLMCLLKDAHTHEHSSFYQPPFCARTHLGVTTARQKGESAGKRGSKRQMKGLYEEI